MVSEEWLRIFPSAKLYNLEISTSDHSPIFLEPIHETNRYGRSQFRFENAWLREPLCMEIVVSCWDNMRANGIQDKIKLCAEQLGKWGAEFSGSFKKRIAQYKSRMQHYRSGRDDVSVQRYKENKEGV